MNRYYDEEEYNIPGSNPCLYSNIKVLREEARLNGVQDLSLDEINAEIDEVRRIRKSMEVSE